MSYNGHELETISDYLTMVVDRALQDFPSEEDDSIERLRLYRALGVELIKFSAPLESKEWDESLKRSS